MIIAHQISAWLLQAARLQDTIVAKTMPAGHSVFDYTSGTLQIIVLLLAIVVLAVIAYVLLAVKKAVDFMKTTVETLHGETRPLLQKVSGVTDDARGVVAMLKTEVERVSNVAGTVSQQMLDVAEATGRRMDDINAVIDVVHGELEETVLSTTAALRGARMGGRAFASVLGATRRKKPRVDYYEDDRDNGPRLRDRHSRQQRDAGD